MTFKNAKGRIFYGMHFYPGVAEYRGEGKEPFRVFLNEDTIRAMGPSFAGRPVFVHHVNEVSEDINELKHDADGWVIESFFNDADGKHWVKFIVCSEKAEKAIADGYRLSNCYVPLRFGNGGEWNGVPYQKEVQAGEYEHLAIVQDPRYAESIILSPEEFKQYNESKKLELTKLSNEKGEGMKLKLFNRTKVENAADIENMVVVLPKSNREVSITQLVNEADEAAVQKEAKLANGADLVEVDGEKMTVTELVEAFMNAKKKNEDKEKEEEVDEIENEDDEDEDDDEDMIENEEEVARKKEEDEKEVEDAKAKNKKKNSKEAKEKAERLRNAHRSPNAHDVGEVVPFTPFAAVERGKARYGS